MPEKTITYFDRNGPANTAEVVRVVAEAVKDGGISSVILASTTGKTAEKFREALPGDAQVVCVTYHAGWAGGDKVEIGPEKRLDLERKGIRVLMCSHALSGVSRSVSKKFGGVNYAELIAGTLKLFGQGIKVAVEVAVMAADAGLIGTDKDVIAVGGTGKGADAACVLKAAHQNNFFDLRIREILAMVRKEGKES